MINQIDFSSNQLYNLSAYLESRNWIVQKKAQSNFQIWHRPEKKFQEYEIVQPLDRNILGYKQRIFELITTLSIFESRDSIEIIKDIDFFSYDILKVRLIGEQLNDGYININDGVMLFEKVKSFLHAILHAIASKKSFYPNPTAIPAIFDDYYKSLKLGQTEHGSYIVNILAPHKNQANDQFESFENNLTSNISENFNLTLEALQSSIKKYEKNHNFRFFQESISKGVSANLCDSLIGMSGKNHNYDIEISIKSRKTKITSRHKFNSSTIQFLKEASDYLKGHQLIENYNVIGTIINLKQQPEENFGEVTIKFKYNQKTKNIKLRLESQNYIEAVKAHAEKSVVSILGDLAINGKNTILLNSQNLITNHQLPMDLDQ
ncbi:hypothetical protein [Acinetobacter pragensis]|uniref:hypothetical protein n=1 Tax=Acinetobacter pragensis TaxID=1806892 RepID=UPI0033401E5A